MFRYFADEAVFCYLYLRKSFWTICSLGVNFWKVGSRKVYAVTEQEVESHRRCVEEESIVTVAPPKKKRRSFFNDSDDVQESIENLISEVSGVKSEMMKLHKLAFRHHFSVSFLAALDDAFSCSICKRVPPKKPLIGCRDCNSLIGCQRCTNRWFGGPTGLDKTCPKCRCERGLSKTFVMRGFDELVDQISEMNRNLASTDEESSDDSQSNASVVRLDDD